MASGKEHFSWGEGCCIAQREDSHLAREVLDTQTARESDYLQEDQRDRQTECTGSSFSIITLFLLLAVCFETEVARSRYRAPTGVQSVRFRQSNLPLSSFILVVYTSDKLFLPC
jgi:hypothetical protein